MKKIVTVLIAFALIFACTFQSFAGNNGKMYDVYVPEGFTETLSVNGEIVYENKKTGSSIDILLSENNSRLFYVGASEEAQKSFTDDFMAELISQTNKAAEGKGYSVTYEDTNYCEKSLEFIKGFEITCKGTKTTNDGKKPVSFDSEFYFFSTKDLVIKIQCRFFSEKDKESAGKMISAFRMDGEVLTADNVMDSLPSVWILAVPLALIVLIVVIIVIVKKNKKKTKAEKSEE